MPPAPSEDQGVVGTLNPAEIRRPATVNSGWKGPDFADAEKATKPQTQPLALSLMHCVCALTSTSRCCMPWAGPAISSTTSLSHNAIPPPASFAGATVSSAALSLGFLCSFATPFF